MIVLGNCRKLPGNVWEAAFAAWYVCVGKGCKKNQILMINKSATNNKKIKMQRCKIYYSKKVAK